MVFAELSADQHNLQVIVFCCC